MAEDTEKILNAIEGLRTELYQFKTELYQFKTELDQFKTEVKDEIRRWDDRFFQLSKDTLGFTRAVVTTAAIVAVLTPLLLKILDSPLFNPTIGKLLGD